MSDSRQYWIERNRPPRVQITYDVETGGAQQKKEIPFVVGVLADLAGDTEQPKLKDRKFVEIDRDNFDEVMGSIAPSLASLTVENSAGEKLKAELAFRKIDDFHPAAVIDQVPRLKQLLEARQQLSDFITKLDGNDALEAELRQVISTDGLKQLKPAEESQADETA